VGGIGGQCINWVEKYTYCMCSLTGEVEKLIHRRGRLIVVTRGWEGCWGERNEQKMVSGYRGSLNRRNNF
jgi:hypothetical protein